MCSGGPLLRFPTNSFSPICVLSFCPTSADEEVAEKKRKAAEAAEAAAAVAAAGSGGDSDKAAQNGGIPAAS